MRRLAKHTPNNPVWFRLTRDLGDFVRTLTKKIGSSYAPSNR